MSVVSKAQLKNEFADGQVITESTMDNLIDSTYNTNLVAGTDITLVPSGNDITINSTGGAGTLQDVLTAGSVGSVPTLIDIRSTGLNNFLIEAGNNLELWGLTDATLNGVGGDTSVLAQDNIYLSTAAIINGTINLDSVDITLTASGNITFEDGVGPLATIASLRQQSFILACSDETTALTTGTAKVTFRMPYAFTLTSVTASLTTAGTGANLVTVDINETGVSILSTKITIDATQTTSTTATTPPIISDTTLAADAQITIDIDQIDSGGVSAGLKVTLIGHQTV